MAVFPTAVELDNFYARILKTDEGDVWYAWLTEDYLPKLKEGRWPTGVRPWARVQTWVRKENAARSEDGMPPITVRQREHEQNLRELHINMAKWTSGKLREELAQRMYNELRTREAAAVTSNILSGEAQLAVEATENAIEPAVEEAARQIRDELEQLRTKFARAEASAKSMERDNAEMREELEAARDEAQRAQAAIDRLQDDLDEARRRLGAAEIDREAYLRELAAYRQQAAALAEAPLPPPPVPPETPEAPPPRAVADVAVPPEPPLAPPPPSMPSAQIADMGNDVDEAEGTVEGLPAAVEASAEGAKSLLLADIRRGGDIVKLRPASKRVLPPKTRRSQTDLVGALSTAMTARRGALMEEDGDDDDEDEGGEDIDWDARFVGRRALRNFVAELAIGRWLPEHFEGSNVRENVCIMCRKDATHECPCRDPLAQYCGEKCQELHFGAHAGECTHA